MYARSFLSRLSLATAFLCASSSAQTPNPGIHAQRIVTGNCTAKTAIEFIAPMPAEEIPILHGIGPFQSWHVILEIALEQLPGQTTPVREMHYKPSPGLGVPMPTDVNNDGQVGDSHPGMPGLVLTMSDDLFINGKLLQAGTNLASFFDMIGSEIEHGGDQTTTLAWIVTPNFMVIDIDLNNQTTLTATINGKTDSVVARHGFDPQYFPCAATMASGQTPTVSIFTPDWISTIDDNVFAQPQKKEAFFLGVEVRIPCWFDATTNPPTPKPLDPIPGPGLVGMMLTGNFLNVPGPGPNPAFPSYYVTFSDNYMDWPTNSGVMRGIVGGGTCNTIYGTTGQNLGFAFEQASVSSWYGVDGQPNLVPVNKDDQMIYRFAMIGDGQIFEGDVLPLEMMITATIETECNMFSITNVRVKHKPDVSTPDPGP